MPDSVGQAYIGFRTELCQILEPSLPFTRGFRKPVFFKVMRPDTGRQRLNFEQEQENWGSDLMLQYETFWVAKDFVPSDIKQFKYYYQQIIHTWWTFQDGILIRCYNKYFSSSILFTDLNWSLLIFFTLNRHHWAQKKKSQQHFRTKTPWSMWTFGQVK